MPNETSFMEPELPLVRENMGLNSSVPKIPHQLCRQATGLEPKVFCSRCLDRTLITEAV